MNWSHLPEPGGIYQQHPQLLDEWLVIWQIKSRYEKKKQQEQEKGRGKKSRR